MSKGDEFLALHTPEKRNPARISKRQTPRGNPLFRLERELATEKQLRLLASLCKRCTAAWPSADQKARWSKMTRTSASKLIDTYEAQLTGSRR